MKSILGPSMERHGQAFAMLTLSLITTSALTARTHSNSQLKMPHNMMLADVDGNGLKDLVGYTQDASGFRISVVSTNWGFRKIVSFDSRFKPEWSGVAIGKIWTGRFLDKKKESICFRAQTPVPEPYQKQQFYCFAYTFYFETGAQLTQVASNGHPYDASLAQQEIAVGDFDGDGYDEIFGYTRSAYARMNVDVHRFYITGPTSGFFFPVVDINKSAFTNFAWMNNVSVQVGNFGDFLYGPKQDDLLVINHATRQIARFDSRFVNGQFTFVQAFVTPQYTYDVHEEVRVAEANGYGLEDLVIRNFYTGHTRRCSLSSVSLYPLPYGQPVDGDMPRYAQFAPIEHHTFYALMKRVPTEGYETNVRDDVFVYFPWTDEFRRIDARWSSPNMSYFQNYSATGQMLKNALGIY